MVRTCCIILLIFALLPAVGLARPYAPDELAALVRTLADADAEARDAARVELMGLAGEDLPRLREVVRELAPLPTPVQLVLRDVVVHVHMAGQIERQPSTSGFLGVSAPDPQRFPGQRFAPGGFAPEAGAGAFVDSRIRGFVAYRMLRNGDLIIGIEANGMSVAVDDFMTLSQVIPNLRPGQQVTLRIRRGGAELAVNVRLDPNINQQFPDRAAFDGFLSRVEQEAVRYWETQFAPVVDGKPEAGI